MEKLLLLADWIDDCQGKKDYDGEILGITTRYWGSRDYTSIGGRVTKPSASSGLVLFHKDYPDNPGFTYLIEQEFEADTEDKVKELVEVWAQQQMDIAVKALKEAFKK